MRKEKVRIISNRQNVCPYCNSQMITRKALKLEFDHIYYPCTCYECKRDFEEWFYLKFVGHNVGANGQIEASYVLNEEIEY